MRRRDRRPAGSGEQARHALGDGLGVAGERATGPAGTLALPHELVEEDPVGRPDLVDEPALGADIQRNNDFNYGAMDPQGYACPVGSHVRRMNPRDTGENIERRKMVRRGGTYGPALPEGAPDDGVERGIASFLGCASLVRQFEFAMNVWANDPDFKSLGNERDPIIGTQDGTFDMTIPRRPIRKKIQGLPSFTTVKGGAYFFLPGLRALQFLATGDAGQASSRMATNQGARA